MFVLSPDGGTLVYQGRAIIRDSAAALLPQRLFRRDFGSLTPVALAGTEGATSLSISPDGAQIAFVSGNKLQRVPLQGGPVSTIAMLPPGFIGGTDWRDNEHVIVSVQSSLLEASIKDGQFRTLLAPDSLRQQITGAVVLPGAAGIAFAYVSLEEPPVIHLLEPGSTRPRRLMQGASPRYVPAWRSLVINRFGRLLAYPFDPATGDTLGAAVRIVDGITLRAPVLAHGEYDIAPNGTFVVTRRQEGAMTGWSPTSEINLVEKGVLRRLPLPVENLVSYDMQFAPNGQRLLLTARSTTQQGLAYSYDLARNSYSLITDQTVVRAAWTDGGDSVIYTERHGGDLMIRAADGSGVARRYAALQGWYRVEALSVRGDWVAISGRASPRASSVDIALVKRGQTTPLTPFADSPIDELSPAISPDRQWIAYTSLQSGRPEVYVSPFPSPTSRTLVSIAGGTHPAWSGDGKTLSYATADGAFVSVAFRSGSPLLDALPRRVEADHHRNLGASQAARARSGGGVHADVLTPLRAC
jgi:eukaryotic-like serine/threonine-protein kinase